MPLTLAITTLDAKASQFTHNKLPQQPIMFYFDASWSKIQIDEECQEYLDKYFTAYAVGREVSKSGEEHYQVLAVEKENGYQNMIATLKRKFNLKGRAVKGQRRQYGRDRRCMNDIEKAIAYSIKPGKGHGKYFSKGFDLEYLKYCHEEVAFEKKESRIDKYNKVKLVLKEAMIKYNEEHHLSTTSQRDCCDYLGKLMVEIYFTEFSNLPTKGMMTKLYYEIGFMTSESYYLFTMGGYANFVDSQEKAEYGDYGYSGN